MGRAWTPTLTRPRRGAGLPGRRCRPPPPGPPTPGGRPPPRPNDPQAFIMPTWQSEKSNRTGSRGSSARSDAVMSAAIFQPGLV